MFGWTVYLKGGPKGHHAAVAVGHEVYSIGGEGNKDNRDEIEVHVFNTVSLRWVKLPSVKTLSEQKFPSVRKGHTAVLIEDIIYVWGGEVDGIYCNKLYAFDVHTHRWFMPEVSGTVPEERKYHSACASGKFMYVCGGYNGTNWTNNMYKLDTTTMVWSLIDTRGTQGLQGHSATMIGAKMFVFNFNSVRVFDTDTDCWLRTPSEATFLPEGRWNHSAFAYNGELYIFGGEKYSLPFNDTWKFNPKTFSWKKVELKRKGPRASASMCCCVVGDRVILSGGHRLKSVHVWVGGFKVATPADDLHILDLSLSLTTLCTLAVIENGLEQSGLPRSIRDELASMNKQRGKNLLWMRVISMFHRMLKILKIR